MVAPALNDYEYMFKDNGFLINGPAVLPFIDVPKVTGLDMPDYDPKIDDHDSMDGSLIYVKYSKHRTIVIDGELFADPSTIEATIDALITNFLPDNTEWPFYFKHPGVAQRNVRCKSLGMKTDTDTLRRTGRATVQVILAAENPHKRVENVDTPYPATNTNMNITNSGNVATWPIITVNGPWSTITLRNVTTSEFLTLTRTSILGDIVSVDMRKRMVTVNGIQNSSIVTAGSFWDIDANTTISTRYNHTGSQPTSVIISSYNGWM